MPSTKYSCLGSSDLLTNGRTAIDGLSGSARTGRARNDARRGIVEDVDVRRQVVIRLAGDGAALLVVAVGQDPDNRPGAGDAIHHVDEIRPQRNDAFAGHQAGVGDRLP